MTFTKEEEERIRDCQKCQDDIKSLLGIRSLLRWGVGLNITVIIAMVGWMFIYTSSQNKNITTHEFLQKELAQKAPKSKLNFTASWIAVMDSNKQRASAYYHLVVDPDEDTRGVK